MSRAFPLKKYLLTILAGIEMLLLPLVLLIPELFINLRAAGAVLSQILLLAMAAVWLITVLRERRAEVMLSQIPVFCVLALHGGALPFRKPLEDVFSRRPGAFNTLGGLSAFLLTALVLFIAPLSLMATDMSSIPFSFANRCLWHGLFAAGALVLLFLFYRFSPEYLRPLLAVFFFSLAAAAWVYTFLLPGDYGVLDVTTFSNPGRLNSFKEGVSSSEIWLVLGEAAALIAALLLLIIASFKLTDKMIFPAVVLVLMTLGQGGYNILSSPEIRRDKTAEGAFFSPHESAEAFRFSDEENIVVFMLDMFGGGLIPDILEHYPHLADVLDGFVWYPNTLSVGLTTYGSLPAILAGPDFSPENVNKRTGQTLDEMIKESYQSLIRQAQERRFHFTYMYPVYFPLQDYTEEWDISVVNSLSFMEYWISHSEEAAALNFRMTPAQHTRLFSVIGFFKSAPHFLRPYIYLDGLWLMQNRGNLSVRHPLTHLSLLDSLTDFAYVDKNAPPAFKFIDSELPHTPWAIDKNLKLTNQTVSGKKTDPVHNVPTVDRNAVMYSAARTLQEVGDLVQWLEANNIKDKTKIILVADHGFTAPHGHWEETAVIRDDDGQPVLLSARANSLLMVKDFSGRGPMRTDKRLMTVADVPSIVFNTPGNPAEGEPKKRTVFVNSIAPHPNSHGPEKYNIGFQFAVDGDPALLESWKRVDSGN